MACDTRPARQDNKRNPHSQMGYERARLKGQIQHTTRARGASSRSSFGSHSRPVRAVTSRKAVLVTSRTTMRSCTSASAKAKSNGRMREACGRARSSGSGSSEAHLAELQQKVGDDGSSGCGGEYHDGGDADGASGDERNLSSVIGCRPRVEGTRRGRRQL